MSGRRIDIAAVKVSAFAWVGALHVGDQVAWRCVHHHHAEAGQAIICARNARLVVAPADVPTLLDARELARLWRRRR